MSLGREDIDIAETRAVGFKGIAVLVEGVRYHDVVADRLNIEGNKTPREPVVHERLIIPVRTAPPEPGIFVVIFKGDGLKGIVIQVDAALGEVCRVKVALP